MGFRGWGGGDGGLLVPLRGQAEEGDFGGGGLAAHGELVQLMG